MKTLGEASVKLRALFEAAGKDYFSFGCFRDSVFKKNGFDKQSFYTHPGSPVDEDKYAKMISDGEKLLGGYPLQYYLSCEYFCGYEFYVDENVLIPRPLTQAIPEQARGILPENGKILDLCCGSGCIGCSVLKMREDVRGVSADISPGAVKVAKRNAASLGVSDRMTFLCRDVFTVGTQNAEEVFGKADAVLSNPPYIKSRDMEKLPENVRHEPETALDGGADGLAFYDRIFEISSAVLNEKGVVLLECGFGDEPLVAHIANRRGFDVVRAEKQLIFCQAR